MAPRILFSTSALLVFVVGAMHLYGTFFGTDLRPRDPALEASMGEVSPHVTTRTTMWRAWIGFNAMMSSGLMLFGMVYGYLAVLGSPGLLSDRPLQVFGAIFLIAQVALARRYLFDVPVAAFTLALAAHGLGAVMAAF